MDKATALLQIARVGYDVGFGSKKHFATYDLIEKSPGWLAFFSLIGGLWALFVPAMESKHLGALFIVFSFVTFYVNQYMADKDKYQATGKVLVTIYHQLAVLSAKTASLPDGSDFQAAFDESSRLRDEAIGLGITKQIFASDWYAHFKFFFQTQHDWVDAQLHFRLFKDKIPAGLYAIILVALIGCAATYIYRWSCL